MELLPKQIVWKPSLRRRAKGSGTIDSFDRFDPQERGRSAVRVDTEETARGQHVEKAIRALLDIANALPEVRQQPLPPLLEPLCVEFDPLQMTCPHDATGHE